MLSMPASPSPIPSYVMASMGAPQYTMTTSPTPPGAAGMPLPAMFHLPYGTGANFGGVDGLGPYGSVQGGRGQFEGAMSHDTAPPPPGQGPGLGPQTPRFYKLDFPTYDGTVDPLNWINQCEQFFRGQRTPASDRTWLASYHLTGAAQTWYYALEQDEGMPAWGRFRELCTLRFGPAVRGTRLSELARLPFISTVHDYAERFNAVLCHAHNLSASQKAELFVGGLPDHIRIDVELREPQNLQTAMHLARAFERRAAGPGAFPPVRGGRSLSRPPPSGPPRQPHGLPSSGSTPSTGSSTPTQQFRRLTPAEQMERRRQGLCYNCDEPYVRGHVCQRLFYLESADYVDDTFTPEDHAGAFNHGEPGHPAVPGADAM
jgi:hypothetical protein